MFQHSLVSGFQNTKSYKSTYKILNIVLTFCRGLGMQSVIFNGLLVIRIFPKSDLLSFTLSHTSKVVLYIILTQLLYTWAFTQMVGSWAEHWATSLYNFVLAYSKLKDHLFGCKPTQGSRLSLRDQTVDKIFLLIHHEKQTIFMVLNYQKCYSNLRYQNIKINRNSLELVLQQGITNH